MKTQRERITEVWKMGCQGRDSLSCRNQRSSPLRHLLEATQKTDPTKASLLTGPVQLLRAAINNTPFVYLIPNAKSVCKTTEKHQMQSCITAVQSLTVVYMEKAQLSRREHIWTGSPRKCQVSAAMWFWGFSIKAAESTIVVELRIGPEHQGLSRPWAAAKHRGLSTRPVPRPAVRRAHLSRFQVAFVDVMMVYWENPCEPRNCYK